MSTLQEVSESQQRLKQRGVNNPSCIVIDAAGVEYKLVRTSLRELGFTSPPSWDEVMRRVSGIGRWCPSGAVEFIQSELDELADVVRPVIEPVNGRIMICHGGGLMEFPITAPHDRLLLDVEVVYQKAA